MRAGTLAPKRSVGLGLNQQSYDLGAARVRDLNATSAMAAPEAARAATAMAVRRTVSLLEDNFSLVMVAERMQESLVLLAHLLCLPLSRMVALRKNTRKKEARVSVALRRVESSQPTSLAWI